MKIRKLFSDIDLSAVIEKQLATALSEVNQLESNRLLQTASNDLTTYLCEKHEITPPVIRRDLAESFDAEAQVDVRYDGFRRGITDTSRAVYVQGQRVQIKIPIEGDAELLLVNPNRFDFNARPQGIVHEDCLSFLYEIAHDDQRDINPEIERDFAQVEAYLTQIRNAADQFKHQLAAHVASAIDNRKKRILSNQGRMASLIIPVRKRSDVPQTYTVPEIRRKATPTLPPASAAAYESEPTLATDLYEHIIAVMQNMAHVMERSPSAFESMPEEDLRVHFLVQLNGYFEGAAHGETFNLGGKTDILLRHNDTNLFIGECKFWEGPSGYGKAIGQLLGYVTWRDTKTALVIFNKDKDFSAVLEKIVAETESHPCFKRRVTEWRRETAFRFIFRQPNDANREFILTVMAFNVPVAPKTAKQTKIKQVEVKPS